MGGLSLSISLSIRELLLRQIYLNTHFFVAFSYFVYLVSVCLSILLTFVMCFSLIYFILGNVRNCIEMYLGIFVNETETELKLSCLTPTFAAFCAVLTLYITTHKIFGGCYYKCK